MRPRHVQIAIIAFGGVLLHTLWTPGHITNQTSVMTDGNTALVPQAEQTIQVIRSIRVGSDDSPWIIMHTLLAFGSDFEIMDVKMDRPVRILDWICGPGSGEFFQVVGGDSGPSRRVSLGVRSYSECHPDQWFCILSAHGVPLRQRIVLGGECFTLRDLLETGKQQSASGCSETLAWTIPALCHYLPRQARWQNGLGQEATMAGLATNFLQKEDWRVGPCSGTHHLHALASLKAAGILKGEAATRLDEILQGALRLLQRNQNADGTWMCNWQTEKDKAQNVFDTIQITGHHLEWVALAASEGQLREKWLQNAVRGLVTAIQETDVADVEKATRKARPEVHGSLCRAARGLHLINRRWTCAP